jgi:hypothetical protein
MPCVPVAVMDVDVEDRNPLSGLRAQVLGRDCGVVDVAEAASTIGKRVMAGRTAERVGHAFGQCSVGGH